MVMYDNKLFFFVSNGFCVVQEIGKYRGILHTASSADKMVKDKFEANRAAIEMLSKNEVVICYSPFLVLRENVCT